MGGGVKTHNFTKRGGKTHQKGGGGLFRTISPNGVVFRTNKGGGVFRTILPQMWCQGGLRGSKIGPYFRIFSLRSRSRMDRNGPETVQNAPKTHFWVILTHFGLPMVRSPCSFVAFYRNKTAKSGQRGPSLDQKWLSKSAFCCT